MYSGNKIRAVNSTSGVKKSHVQEFLFPKSQFAVTYSTSQVSVDDFKVSVFRPMEVSVL